MERVAQLIQLAYPKAPVDLEIDTKDEQHIPVQVFGLLPTLHHADLRGGLRAQVLQYLGRRQPNDRGKDVWPCPDIKFLRLDMSGHTDDEVRGWVKDRWECVEAETTAKAILFDVDVEMPFRYKEKWRKVQRPT